ncbi:MAG: phosphoglycerate mutase family protein, partial [Phycisphaerales bacterium]|nr:phosphoglycerate mutase family protein [Phycisphaerales bacterium]
MPVRRAAFTLVLIRAGETSWEQDGRLLGRADLPLSDRGRAAVVA